MAGTVNGQGRSRSREGQTVLRALQCSQTLLPDLFLTPRQRINVPEGDAVEKENGGPALRLFP